jgi:cytochrome c556
VKKFIKMCIMGFCTFAVTTGVITCGWENSKALGENNKTLQAQKSTPTGSLMRIISSHTAKMFDAIMIGDFNAVAKESNEVTKASKVIMRMFFPDSGKVDVWFKETGKDPNDPEAVKAMKEEFEKYSKAVVDAANRITEASGNKNIVEAYENFDAMVRNACFACHEVSRLKWPKSG